MRHAARVDELLALLDGTSPVTPSPRERRAAGGLAARLRVAKACASPPSAVTAFSLSLFFRQWVGPDVLDEYRQAFRPSHSLAQPRCNIAVAGACAETSLGARRIMARYHNEFMLPTVYGSPVRVRRPAARAGTPLRGERNHVHGRGLRPGRAHADDRAAGHCRRAPARGRRGLRLMATQAQRRSPFRPVRARTLAARTRRLHLPAIRAALARRAVGPVPVVLQMSTAECGAACLAMILGYHGRPTRLEECREACGVNRDGMSTRVLVEVARRFGLRARGFSVEPRALARVRAAGDRALELQPFRRDRADHPHLRGHRGSSDGSAAALPCRARRGVHRRGPHVRARTRACPGPRAADPQRGAPRRPTSCERLASGQPRSRSSQLPCFASPRACLAADHGTDGGPRRQLRLDGPAGSILALGHPGDRRRRRGHQLSSGRRAGLSASAPRLRR